jgi:hypothetical protein
MGFTVSCYLSCKASIGFLREACAQIVEGSGRVVKQGIEEWDWNGGKRRERYRLNLRAHWPVGQTTYQFSP